MQHHCSILRHFCCMQDCQLSVYKPNPRQYVATISQVNRCQHGCRAGQLMLSGHEGCSALRERHFHLSCSLLLSATTQPWLIIDHRPIISCSCWNVEMWFQQASDVLRKLVHRSLDIEQQ